MTVRKDVNEKTPFCGEFIKAIENSPTRFIQFSREL